MTLRIGLLSSRGQVTVALMLGVYLTIGSRSHFIQMLNYRCNDTGAGDCAGSTFSAMNTVYQTAYAAVQVSSCRCESRAEIRWNYFEGGGRRGLKFLKIICFHLVLISEFEGQIGWANFLISRSGGAHPSDLQIPKINLRVLANYKRSFGTNFKVLGENWWETWSQPNFRTFTFV